MKKFINEHPKMYWMIVGVLAVIVFSIVTAIGCAKLERAEAAETSDGIYYPYLREVDWGAYSHLKESALACEYAFIYRDDQQRYHFVVGNNPELISDSSFSIGYNSGQLTMQYEYDVRLNASNVVDYVVGNSTFGFMQPICKLYGNTYVGTNYDLSVYDFKWAKQCVSNNVDWKVSTVQLTYLVNAPYAVIDDYENYNVFLEYPRGEIDMSEFKVEFSLGGQPMNPENGYKMEYTLYVWLPSADYIRSKYGLLMEQDFLQNVLLHQDCYDADVLEWQKNVGTNGDSVLYKIPLTYEFYNNPETGESGRYRIKFDYKDLLDNMEYKLGDGETDFSFREYYGRTKSEWIGWVRKMVFGHALISRMDALVYTQIDDSDTYYGRTTTFTFLRNGNFVYSEVNKDALNEDINSDMSDGINNALQEGLIQSGDKVDELQQNINNVSGSLGSFDTEFEGVDLWNGIKGFGSGLIGLTGFLGNIATALGSVFVFMPYDVRQLVGYFFMASLVVALWKLIKR